MTAHFDDGSSDTGDLLVGADGAGSPVRRQYLPHATHTETGLVGIGGKTLLTERTEALLPEPVRDGFGMYFDRRGQFGITHVMRMPWGSVDGPALHRRGAGRALARPALRQHHRLRVLGDHDVPLAGAAPTSSTATGADLVTLAGELSAGWDPRWLELIATSDPGAAVALSIRTADPVPAWTPSTVTMIGDAIHTMTPGRGAGANTALRDARELRDRLVRVRDGELGLVEAVGEYEDLMRRYSSLAVRESLEFMNDNGTARRPVIGPLSVLAQRTGMRLVDRIPPAKRRMARGFQKVRDSELV